MAKTREDILKEQNMTGKCVFHNEELIEMDVFDIKYAMSEYSIEIAIEFGKWISNNPIDYQPASNGNWIGLDMKTVSTEELFLEFVKQNKIG